MSPDLGPLSEQLLLLQSQSFLLYLLQSHLVVAPQDSYSYVGSSPLHRGALGDPLLVQAYEREGWGGEKREESLFRFKRTKWEYI